MKFEKKFVLRCDNLENGNGSYSVKAEAFFCRNSPNEKTKQRFTLFTLL